MLHKWKKRKKEWKQNIRSKTEIATADFLTKVFKKIGIDNASEKFLAWANHHRKVMFTITMSFLSLVFILSIVTRVNMKASEIYRGEKEKIHIGEEKMFHKQNRIKDLIEVMKLKEELQSIDTNKLSLEDSIKIRNLYKKLTNDENKRN